MLLVSCNADNHFYSDTELEQQGLVVQKKETTANENDAKGIERKALMMRSKARMEEKMSDILTGGDKKRISSVGASTIGILTRNCYDDDKLIIYMDCEDNYPNINGVFPMPLDMGYPVKQDEYGRWTIPKFNHDYHPYQFNKDGNVTFHFCVIPRTSIWHVKGLVYGVLAVGGTPRYEDDYVEIYHDNEDFNNNNNSYSAGGNVSLRYYFGGDVGLDGHYNTTLGRNTLLTWLVLDGNGNDELSKHRDDPIRTYMPPISGYVLGRQGDPGKDGYLYVDDEDHENINSGFISESHMINGYFHRKERYITGNGWYKSLVKSGVNTEYNFTRIGYWAEH